MGSAGGVWVTGDTITAARANQKSVLIDTGANIAAATTYAGMHAYCTSTGSGFTVDNYYVRNAANSAWNNFSTIITLTSGQVTAALGFTPENSANRGANNGYAELDGSGNVPASELGNVNSIVAIATSEVVDILDQTLGDYTTPTDESFSSNNDQIAIGGTGTTTTFSVGTLYAWEITGLTSGQTIRKVGVNVNAAAGDIRMKIYKDDGSGGGPGTLLGETNSTTPGATGWLDIPLISPCTVPTSGNVWVAIEADSTSFGAKMNNGGTMKTTSHTYGTGPSPFGTISSGTNVTVNVRITLSKCIDGLTTTEWVSNSEVNPYAYFDTGSAQVLSALAIYPDLSTTTATQVVIQTSPDASTWTTKRTMNVSELTNGAWNYIRWDLDTSLMRYIRVMGNDGTAKILAIWEVKILLPSQLQLTARHGHKSISPTTAGLGVNA
ncbi:MAG TPA: discoidin domain-containing protein [Candidatus Nitrosotalea sp.]|nr:discoidin domain-containing protein [Candidatus Nitrosotalea sp.]